MKIGLVRRSYSASGGAESYLLRFAEGLTRAGHDWCLFSDADWPSEIIAGHGGSLQKIRRSDSPLTFADHLERAQPRNHCDVLFSLERVHDCDVYRAGDGVHAAWLDRRAVSDSSNALANWMRQRRKKHRDLLDLESTLYDPAAATPAIITNSQMVRQEIIEHFSTPAERLHCITNGYDAPTSSDGERATLRSDYRKQLGFADNEFTVLFTGSGWERKGLIDAITAIEALSSGGAGPRITLIVAGSGKKQPPVRNANTIRFLGPVPAAEMSALYEAADLFVLPTLYDPFSNASLEAAAHGLPVITTDANGFSELIPDDHSTGTVIPVNDPNTLAAAIATWATGPAIDRNIIRHAAAKWTVEKNVRETLEVLEAAGT